MTQTKAQKERKAAARKGKQHPQQSRQPTSNKGKKNKQGKAPNPSLATSGMVGVAVSAQYNAIQKATLRERGSDFLARFEVTNPQPGDIIEELTLTSDMSARMAHFSSVFQRWKPAITFTAVASAPTSVAGQYGIAIVRDPDDTPPTDPNERLQYFQAHSIATVAKWWETSVVKMPRGPDLLYTSHIGTQAIEPRMFSPGILYFYCLESPGANPIPVTINIDWEIEYSMPSLEREEPDELAPAQFTLPWDLVLPFDNQDTGTSPGPTLLLSYVHNLSGRTDDDPVSLQYAPMALNNFGEIAKLPDGSLIELDRMSYTTMAYHDSSTGEGNNKVNLYGFRHLMVRRGVFYKGWDGGFSGQVDGLEPVCLLVNPESPTDKHILRIGSEMGTATTQWHEGAFDGGVSVMAGTILTHVDPALEFTETMLSLIVKGKRVQRGSGRKKWRRVKQVVRDTTSDAYKSRHYPMVRICTTSDDVPTFTGTVSTNPLPNGLAQRVIVSNNKITGLSDPLIVAAMGLSTDVNSPLYFANATQLSTDSVLTVPGDGLSVNIESVGGTGVANGAIPISGQVNANLTQINSLDFTGRNIPVNLLQISSASPATVTSSGNLAMLKVMPFGLSQRVADTSNFGNLNSMVIDNTGVLNTTAGSTTFPSSMDVNIKEVASIPVAATAVNDPVSGQQAFLATTPYHLVAGSSATFNDTGGAVFSVPTIYEGPMIEGIKSYNLAVDMNTVQACPLSFTEATEGGQREAILNSLPLYTAKGNRTTLPTDDGTTYVNPTGYDVGADVTTGSLLQAKDPYSDNIYPVAGKYVKYASSDLTARAGTDSVVLGSTLVGNDAQVDNYLVTGTPDGTPVMIGANVGDLGRLNVSSTAALAKQDQGCSPLRRWRRTSNSYE